MFWYWLPSMIKSPEAPAAMIVFITMMFGSMILYATLAVQAFMNREVIKMMRVPATRKLIFWFENCLSWFTLYMSKIIRISVFESLENSGCYAMNFFMFLCLMDLSMSR